MRENKKDSKSVNVKAKRKGHSNCSETGAICPPNALLHNDECQPFFDNANAVLLNGDCIEKLKVIPAQAVSLLLTDPPYNLGLFMKGRGTNMGKLRENHFAVSGWDQLGTEEWTASMDAFFAGAARVMKKRGSMIVFMSLIKVQSIIELAVRHGFYYKTTGVWHKTNPIPRNMNLQFVNSTEAWLYFTFGAATGTFNNNGRVEHDFVETSVVPLAEKKLGKHPTQKPLGLMKHFVELLTNEGDVVLDPFMGSGSSGVAATQLGRKFIGIELSKDYFELSKQRIESK